ncbi:addiction module protein [Gemmatimonas sp.]|uniref:addiction module protein n=1 Tax=Gemmatimonas sp. TaxID=1962908 RepID=UPI00356946BE
MATSSIDITWNDRRGAPPPVEELWQSLALADVPLTPAQAAELDRRDALHHFLSGRGRPWRVALDEIQRRRG